MGFWTYKTYEGTTAKIFATILGLFALFIGSLLTLSGSLWGPLFIVVAIYELLKVLIQTDYTFSVSSSQGDGDAWEDFKRWW